MGRVKDFYWDEICNREQEDGPEPDDLEMLQIDAERAAERLADALKKRQEAANAKPV